MELEVHEILRHMVEYCWELCQDGAGEIKRQKKRAVAGATLNR